MSQKDYGFLQEKLYQEDQITFWENNFILAREGKADVIYQSFYRMVQKLQNCIFYLF